MSTENVPGKPTWCERGRSVIEGTKAGIVWPGFLHEKQSQKESTIGPVGGTEVHRGFTDSADDNIGQQSNTNSFEKHAFQKRFHASFARNMK